MLYFVAAFGAGAMAHGNMAALSSGQAPGAATSAWLASTGIYALLVILLARLVWKVDARIAVIAATLGIAGCGVQFGAALLHAGREGPVAALFLFGTFMLVYGWLLWRSPEVPTLLAAMFIIAGLGWCSGPLPVRAGCGHSSQPWPAMSTAPPSRPAIQAWPGSTP